MPPTSGEGDALSLGTDRLRRIGVACHALTPARIRVALLGAVGAPTDSYLSSALYLHATGRRGGGVYRSATGDVLVACRHPHLDGSLLLLPALGGRGLELTAGLLAAGRPERPVLLGRYGAAAGDRLARLLRERGSPHGPELEVEPERHLDWRFPVRIVDTHAVSELRGRRYKSVRHRVGRAAGLRVERLSPRHVPVLTSRLASWEESMVRRGAAGAGASEFYLCLLDQLRSYPVTTGGLVFRHPHGPAGFTAYDVTRGNVANLFANVADVSAAGASDVQIVTTCRYLAARGVRLLNLGGSERQGLDDFKRKYVPVHSIPLLTLRAHYR